jgi:hypothetical protein
MSMATFSGPVRSGTVRYGTVADGRNVGLVVLKQVYDTGDLTGTAVGNTNTRIMNLPQGAYIHNITVDMVVAPTTGTIAPTFGTASGGSQLLTISAISTGGRNAGTPTAANLLNWITSTTADTQVWMNLAVATGTLGAGRFLVTILYSQRLPDGSAVPAYNQV